MENYFPDDEYQSPQSFSENQIDAASLQEIIQLSCQEVESDHVEFTDILVITIAEQIDKIGNLLISYWTAAPIAIVITVKSYINADGKERPISWLAETALRRALLVELESNGFEVFYRPIYPNINLTTKMRVATTISPGFLPMSCLFAGYSEKTKPSLRKRFETKVNRMKDSADHWSAGL